MESLYDHIPLRDIHRKSQYLFLFQHPAKQQRNMSIVPWEKKKWIELPKRWENSTMKKYVTRSLIEFFKWMPSLILRSQRVHEQRIPPSPEFKKKCSQPSFLSKLRQSCQISSDMYNFKPNIKQCDFD
jgi:hypothetical protein